MEKVSLHLKTETPVLVISKGEIAVHAHSIFLLSYTTYEKRKHAHLCPCGFKIIHQEHLYKVYEHVL